MDNFLHNAIHRTPNHRLHLHTLNHNQRLVFLDFLALLDFNPQHLARHGRQYAVGYVLDAQCLLGPLRHRELQTVLLALLEQGEAICVADEGCRQAGVRVVSCEGVGGGTECGGDVGVCGGADGDVELGWGGLVDGDRGASRVALAVGAAGSLDQTQRRRGVGRRRGPICSRRLLGGRDPERLARRLLEQGEQV